MLGFTSPAPHDGLPGPIQLVLLAAPTHVDFNLTQACNLSCSYCHANSGARLPRELSTSAILARIAEIHRMGVLSIAFAGGEPFLVRGIDEILSTATSLPGLSVSAITNGTVLTPPALDLIARRAPHVRMNVSVVGSQAERLRTVVRPLGASENADAEDLYRRIAACVRGCVSRGLVTSTNMTITRHSLSDVLPTYRYAINDLGARALVAIKYIAGTGDQDAADRFEPSYQAWSSSFADWTRRKMAGDLPGLQISVSAAWEFYLPLIEADIDITEAERVWGYRSPLRSPHIAPHRCVSDPAGYSELCVHADGRVYPSVLLAGLPELACGVSGESSLDEIWRGSACLTTLRTVRRPMIAGHCPRCALGRVCGGGSRSRAYLQHGSFTAADTLCPLAARTSDDQPPEGVPRPVIIEIPKITNIRTLGSGSRAVRILRLTRGCELRARNHIWRCPEGVARSLSEDTGEARALRDRLRLAVRGSEDITDTITSFLAQVNAVWQGKP
jgi:radical SAM protein with 4Fe4S-binding SPASM domain